MRYIKIASVALVSGLGLSQTAFAASELPPFYVGVEGQYVKQDFGSGVKAFQNGIATQSGQKIDKATAPAGQAFIGMQLNPCWGLELGYNFLKPIKQSFGSGSTEFKEQFVYFDVIGKYGLAQNVDLLGDIGLALTQVRYSLILPGGVNGIVQLANSLRLNSKANGYAGRLGVGLQYQINESFGVRAMARYQMQLDGKSKKYVKDVVSLGLGAVFNF